MLPLPPVPPARKMPEEEFYSLGEYGPRLFLLALLRHLPSRGASDRDGEAKPFRRLRPACHG